MATGVGPVYGEDLDDFVLNVVVEDRIHQDDAVRGDERPGRVLLRAEPVQIVEDLQWFSVIGGALRRISCGSVGRSGWGANSAQRLNAQRVVHGSPTLTCRGFGGLHVFLWSIRRLSTDVGVDEDRRKTNGQQRCEGAHFHMSNLSSI